MPIVYVGAALLIAVIACVFLEDAYWESQQYFFLAAIVLIVIGLVTHFAPSWATPWCYVAASGYALGTFATVYTKIHQHNR